MPDAVSTALGDAIAASSGGYVLIRRTQRGAWRVSVRHPYGDVVAQRATVQEALETATRKLQASDGYRRNRAREAFA